MILTEEEIRKIAHLARLGLTDNEVKKYTQELGGIFNYFEKLNEVDTKNVEPVAQITGLKNVQREDEIIPSNLAEALLNCSPNEIKNSHIVVKNVF